MFNTKVIAAMVCAFALIVAAGIHSGARCYAGSDFWCGVSLVIGGSAVKER